VSSSFRKESAVAFIVAAFVFVLGLMIGVFCIRGGRGFKAWFDTHKELGFHVSMHNINVRDSCGNRRGMYEMVFFVAYYQGRRMQ